MGNARSTIVFDSKADPFTHDGMFTKTGGKPFITIFA